MFNLSFPSAMEKSRVRQPEKRLFYGYFQRFLNFKNELTDKVKGEAVNFSDGQ